MAPSRATPSRVGAYTDKNGGTLITLYIAAFLVTFAAQKKSYTEFGSAGALAAGALSALSVSFARRVFCACESTGRALLLVAA